jgi:hypothetical protein
MEVRRFHTSHAATLMYWTVEGRMVVRVDNTAATLPGYGVDGARYSGTQLPTGVRVPVTQDEANRARFVVAFPVPNHLPPHYISLPTYGWALREGFDRPGNLPMWPDIHMVYPGQKESQYIPSGWNVICYEGGTFTVPSGQWIYDPAIVPGTELEVHWAVPWQQGMLQIVASGVPVAMCREVSPDFKLTFDLYHT